MKDKKGIGEEILGHLKLYRDLGVRYAGQAPPKHGGEGRTPKDITPPTQESEVRETWPAAKSVPPVLIPRASMFDNLPGEREPLDVIRQDLGDCRRCKLAPGRTNIVFGSGNPHAEL